MKLGRLVERWSPWSILGIVVVGIALSFAVMFALSGVLEALGSAVIVLFGSALTFAFLAAVPIGGERMQWPLAPAAILFTFGWMFMVEAASLPAIMAAVWPVIVVAFFAWDVTYTRHHGHGSTPATRA